MTQKRFHKIWPKVLSLRTKLIFFCKIKNYHQQHRFDIPKSFLSQFAHSVTILPWIFTLGILQKKLGYLVGNICQLYAGLVFFCTLPFIYGLGQKKHLSLYPIPFHFLWIYFRFVLTECFASATLFFWQVNFKSFQFKVRQLLLEVFFGQCTQNKSRICREIKK